MMKRTIVLFFLFIILFSVILDAQVYEEEKRELPTPHQMAEKKTQMLNMQLLLSDKQYKKVYKIYLKQARKIQSEQEHFTSGFHSSGSRPMERPQGMPGGPQGMMNGQRYGTHERPGQTGMVLPKENMHRHIYEETKDEIVDREAKMKKILTGEQYEKWLELEKQEKQKEQENKKRKEQESLFPPADKKDNTISNRGI